MDSDEVLAHAREKAEEIEDVADPERETQKDVRLAENPLANLTPIDVKSQTRISAGRLTKSLKRDPGDHSARLAASLLKVEALLASYRITRRILKRLAPSAKM